MPEGTPCRPKTAAVKCLAFQCQANKGQTYEGAMSACEAVMVDTLNMVLTQTLEVVYVYERQSCVILVTVE